MIKIRPVTTIEQCRQIGEIEAAAWGTQDITPDHILLAIAHQKGAVMLAYDAEKPVGFCVCFPSFGGRTAADGDFRLKHHSHIAAVLPSYQRQGIGPQIKWAQRAFVLGQGIDWITWTFDPLQAKNGRLNIHKLGAVCCRYERNLYGLQADVLNAGIESDRFEVDWWLTSSHVQARQENRVENDTLSHWQNKGVPLVNRVELGEQPYPLAIQHELLGEVARLLVAIPSDYQAVKQADLANGIAWRAHTREIFEGAFAQNYTVIDLIQGEVLSYYLLEQDWRP